MSDRTYQVLKCLHLHDYQAEKVIQDGRIYFVAAVRNARTLQWNYVQSWTPPTHFVITNGKATALQFDTPAEAQTVAEAANRWDQDLQRNLKA